MAWATKISKYSSALVKQAQLFDGTPIEIPCASEQHANTLRMKFYGLRRAIEKENAESSFQAFMYAKLIVRGNLLKFVSPDDFAVEDEVALSQARASTPIFTQAPTFSPTRPSTPQSPPAQSPAQSLLSIDFSSEQAALDNFGSVLDSYYGKD